MNPSLIICKLFVLHNVDRVTNVTLSVFIDVNSTILIIVVKNKYKI